ncbi:MAG: ArsR/SmtB family transcription factor [Leptospirales bacterium]
MGKVCHNRLMRSLYHPSEQEFRLENILHALSDPVRLSIVRCLSKSGDRSCGSFDLPVAKSTASHHFRILREAGIIRMQSMGVQYLNSLRKDEIDFRFPGLLEAILKASDDGNQEDSRNDSDEGGVCGGG